MRRFRWWWGALVLACVALLIASFVLFGAESLRGRPQPRQGPPGTGPLTVVALGDSTVSGEGAGDYTPDTDGRNGDWCHRSPNAFVQKVRIPGVTARVNLACSGAPSAQVALGGADQWGERSQAARLAEVVKNHRVSVVVIGVGANDDPKFSAQVNTCFQAWFSSGPAGCNVPLRETWKSKVDAMVPKVVNAVGDVKKVLAQAGYVPSDYQLVLQSYAAPVGPGIPADLQSLNGCPFRTDDLDWIAGPGISTLSTGLRQVATQSGARFLDLAQAGKQHEACSGGADQAKEWFTRLTLHLDDLTHLDRATHALQESFHPNAAGHAAIAGCLSEFLATRDAAAACVDGPGDTLNAKPGG
ncbi:GDSL-type esterase/lipase family protein [Amycolatopsis panacis]|uniref:SGNH hydrolase-type esterase domain-containing protein n=1 Tax=Amycolatopsis panacis TaxID=2340917 RepID=A0A419I7B9_9PSEU|nr:GDSL-type esterase/lipase family protein [Amycolatopsis panacis]RJQ87717.1 hypothetical protein D5S19_09120 [Amycolatopsis panacis]